MNNLTLSMKLLASLFLFTAMMTTKKLHAADNQPQKSFDKELTVKVNMKFFVSLPDDYENSKNKYPLVVFLHGAGEQGSELDSIKRHGMPKLVAAGKKFPFIVVSPQSPVNVWQPEVLNAFFDDLIKTYRVDEDRIYLTGISMGGFGTWNYACAYPDRLAAIAPICGGGFVKLAPKLAHLPIWAFHGALDDQVPITKTAEMIKAVQDAGGKPIFTIYAYAKHDSWTKTYENPEFFKWLLEQKRVTKPSAK